MKINYPKTRKARTTEYSKAHKLISQLGQDALTEVFMKCGIYKASAVLSEMAGWPVTSDIAYYVRRYKLNLNINHNEKNKLNPEGLYKG